MRTRNLLALTVPFFWTSLAHGDSVTGAEAERAWIEFNNARGSESLIRGDTEHVSAYDVFRVIPDVASGSVDFDKLELGTQLFNDTALSRDGSLSCNTCHIAMIGGVDRQPVSFGIGGARGSLNTPTVFNAALNFRQFWDGRALTLQEQAFGPIENASELGHDLPSLVAKLETIPDYAAAFAAVYRDGVTAANLADAIAYYETMSFTGFSSPFLREFEEGGEPLSAKAQRGKQRFVEVGCASCHNGVNLGGNSYQQLGVAAPWFGEQRPAGDRDNGLFGRTARETDRHVFKVPTLHNVANTGPWLHDGSITSLYQAVDRMAQFQLGRYLDDSDIDDIVAFLRSLGDSLGKIGDCDVSGTYAIAMDCEIRRQVETETPEPDQGNSLALESQTAIEASPGQQHELAYQASIERVQAAPARIEGEMKRLRQGEVAHFDFLQYEHFEMMRHARALSYPPAHFSQQQRKASLARAASLQAGAAQYEITIADFLRAWAVANSALKNYQDLLRGFADGADEKGIDLLARAEQSALNFYHAPEEAAHKALEIATSELQVLAPHPDRFEELRTQQRLLLANVYSL